MRAARVHGVGREPVLEEVPDPEPGDGETLVEIAAALVSHFDTGLANGRLPVSPPFPYVPGTGAAGHVLESTTFDRGALVEIRGGGIGVTRQGTWAERLVAPDEAVHRLPAETDPAVGATFSSPFMTAEVALFEVGGLEPGERVAVTGAGGAVGSVVVQLALAARASEVIALVSREERRSAVPTGATVAVGPDEAAGALETSVDLLVDTVGGELLPELIERVRPGGRACLIGYTAGEDVAFNLPRLLFADVRLLPVNLIHWRRKMGDRLQALAVDQLQQKKLAIPVQSFALADVADAVRTLRSGRATGSVVLVPAL